MTEPWSGGASHPREELQDLFDGCLASDRTEAVRSHLDSCEACRSEWARLEAARSAASALRVDRDLPPDLLGTITTALDVEDRAGLPGAAREVSTPIDGRKREWSWPWAAAAAIAVLALIFWGRPPVQESPLPLPAQVARDFEALVDKGTLGLERRTAEATELEAFFAEAPGRAAAPRVRVIDLAMMGFTLEGGRLHVLGAQPSALYSYRTASGERIICEMFEGRLEALPQTADVRENNGFTFRVYKEQGLTMVFWQEGEIVCVLASRLPLDEVVKLAFAKAMQQV